MSDAPHCFVYAIGIFATREEAKASLARQIAEGGPARDDCEVERWRVEGTPEGRARSLKSSETSRRYELSATLGPCTLAEADDLLEFVVEAVGTARGIAWSLRRTDEEDPQAVDSHPRGEK